jgi:hypothetical protein
MEEIEYGIWILEEPPHPKRFDREFLPNASEPFAIRPTHGPQVTMIGFV